jgi:hypothetical protein
MNQALDDTMAAARLICEIQLRGVPADPRHRLILDGMGRMANHLIGDRLQLDDLKIASARAASVAALIRNPSTPMTLADVRFDPVGIANLAAINLSLSRPLNRLKQTNPEAFYYWYRVDQLNAGDIDRRGE